MWPLPACLLLLSHYLVSAALADFSTQQKAFPRVREAYEAKAAALNQVLTCHDLHLPRLRILLIGYKYEHELEVWARDAGQPTYQHLLTYPVCASSGMPGPKRARGDRQVPEGFYFIDRFNPSSNYHLSLGLNYPNAADQLASPAPDLGGDIFIHGGCATVGCLPITDERIQELYLYAVEAHSAGQGQIPVYLFPARLSAPNLAFLEEKYTADDPDLATFWQQLKVGYDRFTATHQELVVSVGQHGEYVVR